MTDSKKSLNVNESTWSVEEAFVHYFSKLQLVEIANLLADENAYSDWSKDEFLHHLKTAFTHFKSRDIMSFEVSENTCVGCNKEATVYTFNPNKVMDEEEQDFYITLFIKTENNIIKDIYPCNSVKHKSVNSQKIHYRLLPKKNQDEIIF